MGPTLSIEIVADNAKARRGLDETASDIEHLTDRANKASGRFGDSMLSIGKAVAAVGAAGVAGIGFLAKGAWDAAEESAKIGRETERVIKSTGASAWKSADQVGELADSLSNVQGVDDEVIQSTANLLLTFTNVRDVVGQGNDVFTQATGLAQDMAEVLGTDASDAAIQLGKALNDPTKGITALSRAGVSFTSDQKEQIKTLQASGDVLGAQKIILAELSKEFGGAAAAAATPFDRLKITAGNAQEAFGAGLIPIAERAATWLGDRIPAAVDFLLPKFIGFASWIIDTGVPAVEQLVIWVGTHLKTAFADLTTALGRSPLEAIKETGQIVKDHRDDIAKVAVAVVAIVGAWKLAHSGIDGVRLAILVLTGVQAAYNAVVAANPWVIAAAALVIAIAAIAAGVFWLATQTEEGRRLWDLAWAGMQAAAQAVWDGVLKPIIAWFEEKWNVIWPAITATIDDFKKKWPEIKEALLDAYDNGIKPLVTFISENMEMFKNLGIVIGVVAAVFVVLAIVMIAAAAIVGVIVVALGALVALIAGVIFVVLLRLANIWWDVFGNVRDAVGGIIEIVEGLIQVVSDVVQNAAAFIWNLVQTFWDLYNNIVSVVAGVVGKFDELIAFVLTLPGKIASAASGLWDGIGNGLKGMLRWVANMWNDSIGSLSIVIPWWVPVIGDKRFDFPRMPVPALAAGGIVTGPTLALLGEAGPEAVVPLGRMGGNTYVINVTSTGLGADSPQIARDVVAAIRAHERRNGPLAPAPAFGGG